MAGGVAQGKNVAVTNRKLYGKDFYARVGAMGGKASTTGGFFVNRELARIAGAKGGAMSRRPNKYGKRKSISRFQKLRAQRKFQREYDRLQAVHDKAQKEREA